MTPHQWMLEYVHLSRTHQWDALIDHVCNNVNTAKEILLSIDPEVQRDLHEALRSK
jgi:phage terminase large subunit-like protein